MRTVHVRPRRNVTAIPDPRLDACIDGAAPFAQPILRHLRALFHRACPSVVESFKWSAPFFEYRGILCFMAEFEHHGGFGFRPKGMAPLIGRPRGAKAMGNFGRITSIKDLPPDTTLLR